MGTLSTPLRVLGGLDGTKIHANASHHSALPFGNAEAIEAHLSKLLSRNTPPASEIYRGREQKVQFLRRRRAYPQP